MNKNVIKKYNQINIIIGLSCLVSLILIYLTKPRFSIIITILIIAISYYCHKRNSTKLASKLKEQRLEFWENNGLQIKAEVESKVDEEYLKAHLPKPLGLPVVKFSREVIGRGKLDNGESYFIDFINYYAYKEDGKVINKQFDMTGYLITLDFGDYQFCNRPLLYFNSHSAIDKYSFQKKHKLEFRGQEQKLLKISSAYHHHRLIAYDGFHDKYMKNVIQTIDFNPNIFKKKFCKAAIFDNSKLHFLCDDNLLPKLDLEYHYTKAEVEQLITDHKQQFDLFKLHIESLSKVSDGIVKTRALKTNQE